MAQACLGHMAANSRALMKIVAGLQGRAGVMGATQHGTFFLQVSERLLLASPARLVTTGSSWPFLHALLQRLVEVVGSGLEGAACILHEDVLGSVATLAVSEVRGELGI